MLVFYISSIYRDPVLFPYSCRSSLPCQKLFKTAASETTHRKSARCKNYSCPKCQKIFKSKDELSEHVSICDEEILAELAIDHHFNNVLIDIALPLNSVVVNDMVYDMNNL